VQDDLCRSAAIGGAPEPRRPVAPDREREDGTMDRGRFRDYADIASVAGPGAGQYLARQRVPEARREEVAWAEALRDAAGTKDAGPSVLARLRQAVGTGLVRATARLRGGRRATPATPAAGPVGTAR
jgi:hypothetical protein